MAQLKSGHGCFRQKNLRISLGNGLAPKKQNSMAWTNGHLAHLTHCGLVMPYDDIDLVNIGSGNGLLPDGTKPLPEPVLTYHK